jgi:hypothetical protein
VKKSCVLGIALFVFAATELLAQTSIPVRRIDSFQDNNFDLSVGMLSFVNNFIDPVWSQDWVPGDDLIYVPTNAAIYNGDVFSRAHANGLIYCANAINSWDTVGALDITAEVELEVDPGDPEDPQFAGLAGWNANIQGETQYIVGTDPELDPNTQLTMHCFVLFEMVGESTGFVLRNQNDQLRMRIQNVEVIAEYDFVQDLWLWVTDGNTILESGSGAGFIDFELPVLQGGLVSMRGSFGGGATDVNGSDPAHDKWDIVASAWFNITAP